MTRLAERGLGTTEAVAHALAIGPVVSVGFASYLAASRAGGALPLTIVIAFAGICALGWMLGLYARRYAGAGGLYEYLASTAPPALALAGGIAFFLQSLVTAVGALVGGLVAQAFAVTQLNTDPGWVVPGLAILALVAFVSLRGIRLSTRWVLGITALGAVPLLVVAVVAIAGAGAQGLTLAPFDPREGDVLAALPYAVLLFFGFEAVACLGEESRDARASIPRAIPIGIGLCGLFYVLTIYAATIGMGTGAVADRWGADPFAIVGLADELVGRPLGALVQLAVLVDIVALAIIALNVGGRGWLALARDRLAPRPLRTYSPWGTPLGGTLLLVGANVALVVLGELDDDPFHVFEAVYTAGPLVVLGLFLVLSGFAVPLVAAQDGPVWRWGTLAVAAVVPVLGIYGTLDPWPQAGPRRTGVVLAIVLLAAAAAWVALMRVRPAGLAAVSRHAAPQEAPSA